MKIGMLHIGAQMLMGHKKIAMESLDLHRKLSYFNPRFFLVVFDLKRFVPFSFVSRYQWIREYNIQPIYTHTQIHTYTCLRKGQPFLLDTMH